MVVVSQEARKKDEACGPKVLGNGVEILLERFSLRLFCWEQVTNKKTAQHGREKNGTSWESESSGCFLSWKVPASTCMIPKRQRSVWDTPEMSLEALLFGAESGYHNWEPGPFRGVKILELPRKPRCLVFSPRRNVI